MTPGPWAHRLAPHDYNPELPVATADKAQWQADTLIGDGKPLHVLIADSTDPKFAYIVPALTGDGPTSAINAEFIAAARDLVPELVAEVERLREGGAWVQHVEMAKTVVYRSSEFRFDVDGQPFPWLISKEGATFSKWGDLYRVLVSIFVIDPETKQSVEFRHLPDHQPLIGDRPFPWAITGPAAYTVDAGDPLGVVTFAFLAENVDADVDIPEYDQGDTEASK